MERFWNKVNKLPGDNACWIWIASKDRYGYGQFKLNNKVLRAHQVSWKIEKGEYASYLCHICDNRACVNPAHLYSGSNMTNIADKINRDRSNGWGIRYSDHEIRCIRREYAIGFSSNQIAQKYNIPRSTVLNILNGKMRLKAGGPIRDRSVRYWSNRYGSGKTGV